MKKYTVFILSAFFIINLTSCELINNAQIYLNRTIQYVNSLLDPTPKTFREGATEAGYNSDLTADQLIRMAKQEGYSEKQIQTYIKGTSWQNSSKVKEAITKYYYPQKTQEISKTALQTLNTASEKIKETVNTLPAKDEIKEQVTQIIQEIPVAKPTSPKTVFNKDNDPLFVKTDELTVLIENNRETLIYKDREMVTIKYVTEMEGSKVKSTKYYFDEILISSKKDSYLYLDNDKEIMKRFETYARKKGFTVSNPLY